MVVRDGIDTTGADYTTSPTVIDAASCTIFSRTASCEVPRKVTMTAGMVDPAIFEHLQAKIDDDTEAREVEVSRGFARR